MDTSFSDPPPKPDHASSVGNEAGLAIGSRVTAASRSKVGSPAQPARRIAAALKIAPRIYIPLLHQCWTRGLPPPHPAPPFWMHEASASRKTHVNRTRVSVRDDAESL